MDENKPSLIEPGVKYFLEETLKQCHIVKNKFNNIVLNIGLFIFFILSISIILFFKYKGNISEEEQKQKDLQKQKYILERIKSVQELKKRESQELITGLPTFSNII
jgi:hypothetical protein